MPAIPPSHKHMPLPFKRSDRALHLSLAHPSFGGYATNRRKSIRPLRVGMIGDGEQNEPGTQLCLGVFENP